jgi:hypothetical protein
MATLDIFANNIIGGNNSVSDSAINNGENPFRWVKIGPSKFFVVKRLTTIDSQTVCNALDAGITGTIIFDQNGNLQIRNSTNAVLLNIKNPIQENDIDTISNKNIKDFNNKSSLGYSASKKIILSSMFKWILHRDDSGQVYILYNPMHTKNVKDYYDSKKSINSRGDNTMNNLMQQYAKALTVVAGSVASSTISVYADPLCSCFNNVRDCVDMAFTEKGYLKDYEVNTLGWACSCKATPCNSELVDKNESFLQSYKETLQKENNLSNCSPSVTMCSIALSTTTGNINADNVKMQQDCKSGSAPVAPPAGTGSGTGAQPVVDTPTTAPDAGSGSAPGVPVQTSKKLPIIIGSSVGGLVLIIILVIIYMKMK